MSDQYTRVKFVCACCNGTGRTVWDADIGTDQECFVCDGTGDGFFGIAVNDLLFSKEKKDIAVIQDIASESVIYRWLGCDGGDPYEWSMSRQVLGLALENGNYIHIECNSYQDRLAAMLKYL
jgi:hypothetical protein